MLDGAQHYGALAEPKLTEFCSPPHPVSQSGGGFVRLGGKAMTLNIQRGREAVDPLIPRHVAALPPEPDLVGQESKVREGSEAVL